MPDGFEICFTLFTFLTCNEAAIVNSFAFMFDNMTTHNIIHSFLYIMVFSGDIFENFFAHVEDCPPCWLHALGSPFFKVKDV